MFFKDIIGQKDVKHLLLQSVKDGYIPHARLISGIEGVGKLPLALAYARYLCCTDRHEDDSCGKCPSCRQFNKLAHPDLHFVFPIINRKKGSSKDLYCDDLLPQWREFILKNPYFSLQQWSNFIEAENSQIMIYARESDEIIRKLNLKAYESEYKIMLVWLPERMHPSCANSLLKVIEEPPAKTVFLLVTESPDRVLGTIQSRAQRLSVPPIDEASMSEAVRSIIGQSGSDSEISNIVHLASGNYLKAVDAITASEDRQRNLELFKSIMRNCWRRDVKNMKAEAEKFAAWGREKQKAFFSYAGNYVRENFFYRFNLPEINYINADETAFAVNYSPYITEKNVISLIDEFALAERHIEANVNPRMVFFDLSMKIAVLIKK
ncbi:MAG: DNA polymerase III subunit [Dysgonamonadaceae bacterium]|nr:DNA polymerase III subunit [Dysgonamonadaceae bacterium]